MIKKKPREPALPRHWRISPPAGWTYLKLEPNDGRLFAIQRCDGPGFFFRPGVSARSARKEIFALIENINLNSPQVYCGCTPEAMLQWEIQLAIRQEKSRGKKAKASLRDGDR